jgi:hypothetical protein
VRDKSASFSLHLLILTGFSRKQGATAAAGTLDMRLVRFKLSFEKVSGIECRSLKPRIQILLVKVDACIHGTSMQIQYARIRHIANAG